VLKANGGSTVLRFGAFTADVSVASDQVVRLHEEPIVVSSTKYDFALLRADRMIAGALNVVPFHNLGPFPVRRDPMYVLQHPKGGPMTLALSTNGVTWIDPGQATVQYTTRTAGGSSGSPCFNANWDLVALHHAGSSSKGEGILMRPIFEQIKEFLSA
jgi:endonuclease G